MLADVRRGVVMMEPVAREVTGGLVLPSEPTRNKEDPSLCILGDKLLVQKDLPTGFELL